MVWKSQVQGEYLLVKINSNDSNVAVTNGNLKEDIPPKPIEINLPYQRNLNQPQRNLGAHVMPRVMNNQKYIPDVSKRRHQMKINHPSGAYFSKDSSNHVISSARPLAGHRRRSGLRSSVKVRNMERQFNSSFIL